MINSLTKKLLRDIWQMRSQIFAIILVIICGIAVFIMSSSTLQSLQLTRKLYYQSQRFADIFVDLKRAPLSEIGRIKRINGVQYVDAGICANVNIEIPDFNDPIQGKLISYDDKKLMHLNQPYLTKGRFLSNYREEEVLVSDAFYQAHNLKLHDTFNMVINGKKRKFTIVGVALSPEYIYQIAPGSLFPDYKRYAIIWMGHNAFAHAYNMDGAFNNLNITILPETNPKQVINEVDHILEPFGGLGAYPRNEQLSHRFLQEEFKQLRTMAILFPLIFFGVAGFLLNIFVIRLIQTQREQIAILKAFGYSNLQIVFHYFQMVILIVILGVVGGIVIGIWMGHGLSEIYTEFYRFPYLHYHLDLSVVITAIKMCLCVSLIGPMIATNRAFLLTPAQGLRPEPPGNFRNSLIERIGIFNNLSYVAKMIWRNIERKPYKSLMTLIGIGCSGGILIVGNFQKAAVDHMIDVQFHLSQKEDIQVSFNEPISTKALYSLRSIPGINFAEGQRTVAVRLTFEHRNYLTSIQGLSKNQKLRHILNSDLKPIRIPDSGIVLGYYFRQILGINIGDKVSIEILEGKKNKKTVTVVGFVKEYVGLGAYMSLHDLYTLLQESENFNGALLSVDISKKETIIQKLNEIPKISGITFKIYAITNFYETFAQTVLIFTFFISLFAGTLAFGLVLNNALISFAEKNRELATLSVLGFTSIEVTFLLLGEIALLTLLAIPVGFVIGALLCQFLVFNLQSELYRVPLILTKSTFAYSCLVVIIASLVSCIFLYRKMTQLNLVTTLKAKE